jgi:hypothetical protein
MTACSTISTTYFGDVDADALERLESSCETNGWLTTVDIVNPTRAQHHDSRGLRDDLLEIDSIALTVLSRARLVP